eukprot:scaffold99535_cov27-Phaeocystis_antarctica.AAC.1
MSVPIKQVAWGDKQTLALLRFLSVWYMPTKGILGPGLLRSDSQEPFRVHRQSWNYGSTGVNPCSG